MATGAGTLPSIVQCYSGQQPPCAAEVASIVITTLLVEILRVVVFRHRRDQTTTSEEARTSGAYMLVVPTATEDLLADIERDEPSPDMVALTTSERNELVRSDIDTYSIAEVAFAAYHTLYTIFCWVVISIALRCVRLPGLWNGDAEDQFMVLDIWLAWILIWHVLCAVCVCLALKRCKVDSTLFFKVPLSLVPGLSEPLNSLRNPILAGIYLFHGPYFVGPFCAFLVAMGALLPLGPIYRRPHILRQLRTAHWPVLCDAPLQDTHQRVESGECDSSEGSDEGDTDLEVSCCGRIWLCFVESLSDLTCPFKQYLAFYEEVPHIIAGTIFLIAADSRSILVCVSVGISVVKLMAVFVCRPFALCWAARAGRPWNDVSAWDISRATSCQLACVWSVRSRAARSLLAPGVPSELQVAAAEALGSLYGDLVSAQSKAPEDVDTTFAKEAMKTKTCLVQLLVAGKPMSAAAKKSLLQMAGEHAEPAAIDAVANYVNGLNHANPFVRQSAAENLATLGGYAAPCVPQLMHGSLKDADENVREAMSSTLRALGGSSPPCAAQIATFLGDPEPDVCRTALDALGSMSERGAPFVSKITDLLEHDDGGIRKSAANSLGELGDHAAEAVPQLISLLDHEIPGVREASAETLARLTEHTSAKVVVPKLVTLLDDNESCVRAAAAEALGAYGEHAAPFSQRLSLLAEDVDPRVRRGAAEALGKLGDEATGQAGKLGKLLQDADVSVRLAAAHALGEMGEAGAPFAAQLERQLRDANNEVRCAAVQTLGQLGPSASPFSVQIARMLADADTRDAALSALGWLGEHARSCAPKLGDLLKDTNPDVRAAAVKALAELGDHAKTYGQQLVRLLADIDSSVRDAAAASLSELGWDGALFAPELAKLLDDSDAQVCYTAIEALGNLGEHAGPHVPQIARSLSDPDPEVRYAATECLGCLAKYATAFVSQVAQNLHDDDNGVRFAALEALGKFGAPVAVGFIPTIASLSEDSDVAVRRGVAETLAKFGSHAKPFVPKLQQLTMDEDEFVSKAATTALVSLSR